MYVEREGATDGLPHWMPRLATVLGFAYLFGLGAVTRYLTTTNRPGWLPVAGFLGMMLVAAVIHFLPDRVILSNRRFDRHLVRFASVVRMGFYTSLIVVLAQIRWATQGTSAIYPVLLWLVPLNSSFIFFMFLRDVYQHSNADTGRLTNSRVFFTDPFTRWAILIYGQDMHIPHHLFPAVPHYRLRSLHEILKRRHTAYHDLVVETHGTFRDAKGRPTILDEMTKCRDAEPGDCAT